MASRVPEMWMGTIDAPCLAAIAAAPWRSWPTLPLRLRVPSG
jgi:hypothetical protein